MCQRSESVCAAILAPKELQQKLQRHDHVLSTKLSTNSEMKASLKGLCSTVQIQVGGSKSQSPWTHATPRSTSNWFNWDSPGPARGGLM